ncbi:unnamed protein product [Soboliphyme baturini]|uniref:Uncharacterized protein n=1 Tax=Soboliphyme baturini TaxID=241478 RepID=A0A183IE99_9BILA|nr:unnamed protein product [Soboliphyme baturini]
MRHFKVDRKPSKLISHTHQFKGVGEQLEAIRTDRRLFEIWKPVAFTAAVGGSCFVGASVWHYERFKKNREFLFSRKYWNYEERVKYGSWRQQVVHEMWQNFTFGQKTIMSLIFANGIVFGAWRLPSLRSTMFRYFTCSFYGDIL